MDLTEEQLNQIITTVLSKAKTQIANAVKSAIEDADIPDTRNLASKKFVTDLLENLKTGLNTEIVALQEAIKKVATETDTKINALTAPKTKPWYATLLDYED